MFPFLVNVSGASFVCMRLLRMAFLLSPEYRAHRVHRMYWVHRALCTRVRSIQASQLGAHRLPPTLRGPGGLQGPGVARVGAAAWRRPNSRSREANLSWVRLQSHKGPWGQQG